MPHRSTLARGEHSLVHELCGSCRGVLYHGVGHRWPTMCPEPSLLAGVLSLPPPSAGRFTFSDRDIDGSTRASFTAAVLLLWADRIRGTGRFSWQDRRHQQEEELPCVEAAGTRSCRYSFQLRFQDSSNKRRRGRFFLSLTGGEGRLVVCVSWPGSLV